MQASILSLPARRSTTAGHPRNLSFGVKAWRQCLQLSWGWHVSSMLWHTPPSPLTLNNFFLLPFQVNRWARFQTHLPTLCHSLLCLLCWFLREWIGHSRPDPSLRGNIGQVFWKRLWTGSDLPRRQSESQSVPYDSKVLSQSFFLFPGSLHSQRDGYGGHGAGNQHGGDSLSLRRASETWEARSE